MPFRVGECEASEVLHQHIIADRTICDKHRATLKCWPEAQTQERAEILWKVRGIVDIPALVFVDVICEDTCSGAFSGEGSGDFKGPNIKETS